MKLSPDVMKKKMTNGKTHIQIQPHNKVYGNEFPTLRANAIHKIWSSKETKISRNLI